MLVITSLHNSTIIVHVELSPHNFAFGFLKKPRTNKDNVSYLQTMIFLLISQRGTPLPTILSGLADNVILQGSNFTNFAITSRLENSSGLRIGPLRSRF